MPRTARRAAVRSMGAVVVVGLVASLCLACTRRTSETDAGNAVPPDPRSNRNVVTSDETPTAGGRLVYALVAETNGWNPAVDQWAPSGLIVARQLFDTITAYDESSNIRPLAAQSFDHNADFTSWTFTLRPGITLHNGKAVTADTVVRAQDYLRTSPVTGPAYRYSNVSAITTVDELTFRVELSKGAAAFPIALATQLGVIVDPDWLMSNDAEKPIGSGPFEIETWEIGNKLVLKRNPKYWQVDATTGARLPYLDSVEFRVIPDSDARSKALRAGDVDVVQSFEGNQVQQFQDSGSYQVHSDTKGESREVFAMLNTTVPPFDDLDARLALAYATDKHAYAEIVTGGYEEVADGPFAPQSPWYAPTDYPQYDPAKARELVERVKSRHGGTFAFTLQGIADHQTQLGMQTLQEQWRDVGIDVSIDVLEPAKLIIGVVSGTYQATIFAQFDAPNAFADGVWWDPRGGYPASEGFTLNFARNRDDAILDALEEGARTEDREAQVAALAKVVRRLSADVPYVWLTHQRQTLIASPRVVNLLRWTLPDGSVGLDLNQGGHPLAQTWLKR